HGGLERTPRTPCGRCPLPPRETGDGPEPPQLGVAHDTGESVVRQERVVERALWLYDPAGGHATTCEQAQRPPDRVASESLFDLRRVGPGRPGETEGLMERGDPPRVGGRDGDPAVGALVAAVCRSRTPEVRAAFERHRAPGIVGELAGLQIRGCGGQGHGHMRTRAVLTPRV